MKPVVLSMLFVLVSCHPVEETPKDRLENFLGAYESFLIAASSDSATFENRQVYLDSALARNGISAREFNEVMDYLKKHPVQMQGLLSRLDRDLHDFEVSSATPGD